MTTSTHIIANSINTFYDDTWFILHIRCLPTSFSLSFFLLHTHTLRYTDRCTQIQSVFLLHSGKDLQRHTQTYTTQTDRYTNRQTERHKYFSSYVSLSHTHTHAHMHICFSLYLSLSFTHTHLFIHRHYSFFDINWHNHTQEQLHENQVDIKINLNAQ